MSKKVANKTFSYSTKLYGNKERFEIPFDPVSEGFRFVGQRTCCLDFETDEYLMSVKNITHVVMIRKHSKSRQIDLGQPVFLNHKQFQKALKDASII